MNDRSDRQIEKALFDATVGIDSSPVRRESLTKACAGDEASLTRIMGWVDAQDDAEEFFRTATIARAVEVRYPSSFVEGRASASKQIVAFRPNGALQKKSRNFQLPEGSFRRNPLLNPEGQRSNRTAPKKLLDQTSDQTENQQKS